MKMGSWLVGGDRTHVFCLVLCRLFSAFSKFRPDKVPVMRSKVFARNKPPRCSLNGNAPFNWHWPKPCSPVTHKSLTDADLGGQACGCLEPAF